MSNQKKKPPKNQQLSAALKENDSTELEMCKESLRDVCEVMSPQTFSYELRVLKVLRRKLSCKYGAVNFGI